MKIMFMGTPDFAKKTLEGLVKSGFEVCAAVSQPDRKKGRGHKVQMTPVKEYALAENIPVYQPETLKDGIFTEILEKYNPDVIVVAAYGKILPEYIINYPKYGCINVHASLLPKYRGAAPIQRAIMDGEKETGVTIMKMDKGLDTGNMLYQIKTEIGEYETGGELFDRLAAIGSDALIHTLPLFENGQIDEKVQDNSKATYAGMLDKNDAKIDWNKDAGKVSKLICAMLPSPSAYTYYNGDMVKITSAVIQDGEYGGEPGDILECGRGKGILVKCGEGAVLIKSLQLPGKKSMPVDDYINGRGVMEGRFDN